MAAMSSGPTASRCFARYRICAAAMWLTCWCERDAASSDCSRARARDGLVRIALKKRFSDGTVAVDMDPLSLLMRLCAGACAEVALGEPHEPPVRAPARAPPYYKTALIRRLTLGDFAAA